MRRVRPNPAQAERQRQATRPGLAVRGTFSPARAWRPAVVARLARTLAVRKRPPMQFTLFYRGPLKSNGRPKDKHELRRHFHNQLQLLWANFPLADYAGWLQPKSPTNELSVLRSVGRFTFAPLVSELSSTVAELEICLLWPQAPGSIITSGGDIDNRLKTLFDALKIPSEPTALPRGAAPQSDEQPFFCLLEDDSLITRVTVETDRILEKSIPSSEVVLTIRVVTRNLRSGWDTLP